MSQHDYNIANATGAAARADINNLAAAIVGLNSGATEPATMFAYQLWADTALAVLRQRNSSNTGWVVLGKLGESATTTMANDATNADIWNSNEVIFFTTAVTVTALPNAPQAGFQRWCQPQPGTVYTNNANLRVQGGASYTTATGDWVRIISRSTTLFDITVFKNDGSAVDGIAKTLIDAAGDLIVGTAADTAGRLAMGTALQKLRVNAGATALEWAADSSGITLGTPQASTSGTGIDFTALPAGVKRIKVHFIGVSTNGTSPLLVQIGDSGGIEASGYFSVGSNSANYASSTAGFLLEFSVTGGAASLRHGQLVLDLENSANNTWTAFGGIAQTIVNVQQFCSGSKSLSATLDRVRITTVNGTDTFDAGEINITYE
jgi:hypothetical protein